MKTTTLTFSILFSFLVTMNLQAQERRFGLSTGYEMDMILPLNIAFLEGTSDIDAASLGSLNTQEAYSSSGCENIHFRLFSSFPVNRFRNTSVYAAFIGIFNRSDRISFYDGNQYFGIGAISNELALEFSLDKRLKFYDIAYLDLGLGNNIGYGYGGSSYLSEYNYQIENELNNRSWSDVATASDIVEFNESSQTEYGDNYSSFNNRFFGKVGAGIIVFRKIELGIAFRYGYGARVYSNSYIARTQYNSIALNSAFRF